MLKLWCMPVLCDNLMSRPGWWWSESITIMKMKHVDFVVSLNYEEGKKAECSITTKSICKPRLMTTRRHRVRITEFTHANVIVNRTTDVLCNPAFVKGCQSPIYVCLFDLPFRKSTLSKVWTGLLTQNFQFLSNWPIFGLPIFGRLPKGLTNDTFRNCF